MTDADERGPLGECLTCLTRPCRCNLLARPTRIVMVAPLADTRTWRFEVQNDDGQVLDYSLAGSRWMAWRLAKSSLRRLMRAALSTSSEQAPGGQ